MAEPRIRDFHAHIYYDPEEVERAKQLAAAAQARFPSRSAISTSGRSARTRAEASS